MELNEKIIMMLPIIIVVIAVSLLLALLAGYLFNYYVIKELRIKNKYMYELINALGFGLQRLNEEVHRQNIQNNSNKQNNQNKEETK